ncbi:hypothetical protein Esti_001676 [Eimeria stiedai]
MAVAGVAVIRILPCLLSTCRSLFMFPRSFSPVSPLSAQMHDPASQPNYLPGADPSAQHESLIVGAGCFWGVEKLFRTNFASKLLSTQVGYAGGSKEHPTYREVCRGTTGHFEAVKIEYFTEKTTPDELLEFFWSIHDPTTKDRQGPDVGSQYRSAVCVHTPEQVEAAERVLGEMRKKWKGPITTEIIKKNLTQPDPKPQTLHPRRKSANIEEQCALRF